MLRIPGEQSACRALGELMGGDDADPIWKGLDRTWCDDIAERSVANVPQPRRAEVSAILANILDTRFGCIVLQLLAMHPIVFLGPTSTGRKCL